MAVDLATRLGGAPDHGGGADHQQLTRPLMAGSADPAQALLAAGRMFLWHQPEPSCQMTARFERRRVNLKRQRQRDERTNAQDGGQPPADRIGPVHRGEPRFERVQLGAERFDPPPKRREHLPCRGWDRGFGLDRREPGREIGRGVIGPDAALVIAEDHVHDPMQAIHHDPSLAIAECDHERRDPGVRADDMASST